MKTPLILCPGLLCDHGLFKHQLEALADVAQMTVPDFRSHGSIEAMADAVLLDAPDRFALLGLSMGSYVALDIVTRTPGRVEKLALLGGSAAPDIPEHGDIRRQLVKNSVGKLQKALDVMVPYAVLGDRKDDPAIGGSFIEQGMRIGHDAFARHAEACIARPDRRADLPSFKLPTLVICGRQDLLLPLPNSEEMAALIPDAELHILEDCGHLSPLEKPDEVNRLLRQWLLR